MTSNMTSVMTSVITSRHDGCHDAKPFLCDSGDGGGPFIAGHIHTLWARHIGLSVKKGFSNISKGSRVMEV